MYLGAGENALKRSCTDYTYRVMDRWVDVID